MKLIIAIFMIALLLVTLNYAKRDGPLIVAEDSLLAEATHMEVTTMEEVRTIFTVVTTQRNTESTQEIARRDENAVTTEEGSQYRKVCAQRCIKPSLISAIFTGIYVVNAQAAVVMRC